MKGTQSHAKQPDSLLKRDALEAFAGHLADFGGVGQILVYRQVPGQDPEVGILDFDADRAG